MARQPLPGSDSGQWGEILNNYLDVAHSADGTIRPDSIDESSLSAGLRSKVNSTAPVTSVAGRNGAVTLISSDVGLMNVDNTSDADKPISTLTSTALSGKASATHTHVAANITDSTVTGRSLVTAADAATARSAIGAGTGNSNLAIGTTSSTAKAGDYVPTKAIVGLSNVDNTSDADKPISSAAAASLALLTAMIATTGTVVESGGVYPARPSGFANIKFIGGTDPGSASLDGDEWIRLT